jgi:hypothetical protein
MKKHLFLGCAFILSVSAYSQSGRYAVKPSTVGKSGLRPVEKIESSSPSLIIQPANGIVKLKSKTNFSSKVSVVSAMRFTGSMNAFGVIVSQSKPLSYNAGINTVAFVHRKSPTYTPSSNGNSGSIVVMYSSNPCTSWDSTCIWANSLNLARYPQGGIYNPLGNTNKNNAYVVGMGPYTDGSTWPGNWYASKQITTPGNTTAGADQQSMTNSALPTTMRKHGFSRYSFASVDGGLVRSIGEILNDMNSTSAGPNGYGTRGAAMVKGLFSAGAFTWSIDSFVPSCVTDVNGDKQMYSLASQAWSENGITGYVVLTGARTGASGSMNGWQPIVYKTTNSGASWSLLPANDFTTPMFKGLTDRLYPVGTNSNLIVPFFNPGEGFDATVDINGNLHYVTTVLGTSSTHPDSLAYTYQFGTESYSWDFTGSFGYPTIYDFYTTTAGGWDYHIVDSMACMGPSGTSGYPGYGSNPWSDGSGSRIGLDARIQVSRTADGKKIFYTWTDSDPSVAGVNWNIFPDLNVKGYDVTIDKATPRFNMTQGVMNADAQAYFHYASSRAISNGTVSFDIPVTISYNSTFNGGAAMDHYYLCGTNVAANAFTVNPMRPTGIESAAATAVNYEVGNYPNPAHDMTVISVNLKEGKDFSISLYNTVGQLIKTVNVNGNKGANTIEMNLQGLNAGIYFYTVNVGNSKLTNKLVIE